MDKAFHGAISNPDSFFGADLQGLQEYEQKPYSVCCDICGAEGYGSEKALRSVGWELGRGYEFCPSH